MQPEIWCSISTFPMYEVSDQGRVKNSLTGRVLKPWKGYGKDGRNYLKVHLYRDGRRYSLFVHRLVVFAFYEVDHKDRKRDNNKLTNLEPVFRKENDSRWRREEAPPF